MEKIIQPLLSSKPEQSEFMKRGIRILEPKKERPLPKLVVKKEKPPPPHEKPSKVVSLKELVLGAVARIQELKVKLTRGHGSGVNADMVDDEHADDIAVRAANIVQAGRGGGGGVGMQQHGNEYHTPDFEEYGEVKAKTVDDVAIGDGKILVYRTTGDKLQYEEQTGGGAPSDKTYITKDDETVTLPNSLQHENVVEANKHTPKAHTLASHSTKAHTELTGVSADQHSDTKIRSKVVDETAIGDDKILVYKSGSDTIVYEAKPAGGAAKVLFGFNIVRIGTATGFWGLNSNTTKTNENLAKTPIVAGKFTKMIINVGTFSFDVAGTITLRKNGVSTALSITFEATGVFVDTDEVSVNENDLVNFTGSGVMTGNADVLVCLVFEPS